MASFSLLILKILSNFFRENILSKKEKSLNEELEVGNRILDDLEQLRNALQNIDLTAVSVAQAMIETAHKKLKSANTDMVLC